jgi:hypothetical protein
MPALASPYRPEFEAALQMLARASRAIAARGALPPVLVGGGAVELFTASAITTGDFDLAIIRDDLLDQELRAVGFVRPTGASRGWVHPAIGLGFEVVSDRLLDGNAERDRVRVIRLEPDGEIWVIAVEDLIADRVAQYASGAAPEMLAQAQTLFDLYPDADLAYLERRIAEETGGEHGIDTLRR